MGLCRRSSVDTPPDVTMVTRNLDCHPCKVNNGLTKVRNSCAFANGDSYFAGMQMSDTPVPPPRSRRHTMKSPSVCPPLDKPRVTKMKSCSILEKNSAAQNYSSSSQNDSSLQYPQNETCHNTGPPSFSRSGSINQEKIERTIAASSAGPTCTSVVRRSSVSNAEVLHNRVNSTVETEHHNEIHSKTSDLTYRRSKTKRHSTPLLPPPTSMAPPPIPNRTETQTANGVSIQGIKERLAAAVGYACPGGLDKNGLNGNASLQRRDSANKSSTTSESGVTNPDPKKKISNRMSINGWSFLSSIAASSMSQVCVSSTSSIFFVDNDDSRQSDDSARNQTPQSSIANIMSSVEISSVPLRHVHSTSERLESQEMSDWFDKEGSGDVASSGDEPLLSPAASDAASLYAPLTDGHRHLTGTVRALSSTVGDTQNEENYYDTVDPHHSSDQADSAASAEEADPSLPEDPTQKKPSQQTASASGVTKNKLKLNWNMTKKGIGRIRRKTLVNIFPHSTSPERASFLSYTAAQSKEQQQQQQHQQPSERPPPPPPPPQQQQLQLKREQLVQQSTDARLCAANISGLITTTTTAAAAATTTAAAAVTTTTTAAAGVSSGTQAAPASVMDGQLLTLSARSSWSSSSSSCADVASRQLRHSHSEVAQLQVTGACAAVEPSSSGGAAPLDPRNTAPLPPSSSASSLARSGDIPSGSFAYNPGQKPPPPPPSSAPPKCSAAAAATSVHLHDTDRARPLVAGETVPHLRPFARPVLSVFTAASAGTSPPNYVTTRAGAVTSTMTATSAATTAATATTAAVAAATTAATATTAAVAAATTAATATTAAVAAVLPNETAVTLSNACDQSSQSWRAIGEPAFSSPAHCSSSATATATATIKSPTDLRPCASHASSEPSQHQLENQPVVSELPPPAAVSAPAAAAAGAAAVCGAVYASGSSCCYSTAGGNSCSSTRSQDRDEPLYQVYMLNNGSSLFEDDTSVSEESNYVIYEDIDNLRSSAVSPAASDTLVPTTTSLSSPAPPPLPPQLKSVPPATPTDGVQIKSFQRPLWCQLPEVIASGVLERLSQDEWRTQEAVYELLSSEASYCRSLRVLVTHFAGNANLIRSVSAAGTAAGLAGTMAGLAGTHTALPPITGSTDYDTIFCNTHKVLQCSESFLADLQRCFSQDIMLSRVAAILERHALDNFAPYERYCANQYTQERRLQQLMTENAEFGSCVQQLELSPRCQSLKLHSFLLLPMQRITRLPMLVSAVLCHTDPSHQQFASWQSAFSAVKQLAEKCNEEARKVQRIEEMTSISKSFTFRDISEFPLISPCRSLVKKGPVLYMKDGESKKTMGRKIGRHQRLHLFLFTDALFLTKKKSDDNYVVLDYCHRNMVQLTENVVDKADWFLLTLLSNHEEKTIEVLLSCQSESERLRWLEALRPGVTHTESETIYESWDCPQVRVHQPYQARQHDEMAVNPGDVIKVLRKLTDGWLQGEKLMSCERGWFPGHCCTEISSAHRRARNLRQRYKLLQMTGSYWQQNSKAAGKQLRAKQ